MTSIEDTYTNNFMFRIAVRDELIKLGYTASDSSDKIRAEITFVFDSFNNMEDPVHVANCLI